MATYHELLRQVRTEIEEVDAARAHELLAGDERPLLVDIREQDEWVEGQIGRAHV